MKSRAGVIVWAVTLALIPSLSGQQSPFLPDDIYNKLTNEISGSIAYQTLRTLTQFHAPSGESQGFWNEAQWVEEQAKSEGLEDVRFVALPPWEGAAGAPVSNWTLKGGELWLTEPVTIKLGDVRETPLSVADHSPSADVTAELVDVGEGSEDSDYAGKDVSGKAVLAYGPLARVEHLACELRGAVAIVSYYSTRTDPWADHADQIAWSQLPRPHPGARPNVPAFVVSPRTGLMLSRWMSGRAPTHIFAGRAPFPPGTRFRVRLRIEADTTEPEDQGFVEGVIHGTGDHSQSIVLTAHLQEGKPSANDDRSGCASLLEIARALETMIRDGRLPRPKRDIRFWWTNEIEAEMAYFAAHPEERTRILADINQDMVGARQSLDGRLQQVSRTPYSRWSFVNDVVESIVESLVRGNNAYLPAWQTGAPAPYSRPIFARLGTREPYRAEVVPYFDDTDHMAFNLVGIPGVDFTNWPDEYIHSSDDDLWQIDPTQLQRNAVAVAASALYLASFGADEVPELTAVVAGGARVRLSRDLGIGTARLAAAPASERDEAFRDAWNLLDQAERREVRGLNSLRPYAAPAIQKLIERLSEDMKLTELNHQKRLEEWYEALAGRRPSPGLESSVLTAKERELDARVPKPAASLADFLRRSQEIQAPPELHKLMVFEALNFADGQRSVLEIYRAVRAESLSAGEWYYGRVTQDQIDDLFKAAEKVRAVEITTR